MTKFSYNSSILNSLEKALSVSRLNRYRTSANGDLEAALEFHIWNARLGQSLHFPMQHFELLLRNALNDQISGAYGSTWYDTLFPQLEPAFQGTIRVAKDELVKQSRPLSSPSVIAQFTFGTWASLLKSKYDQLLWKFHLVKAFPNAPKPIKRNKTKSALEKIRVLRNRIAHHEPIYQRALDRDLMHIITVASWICWDTASWIDHHCDDFRTTWNNPPRVPSVAASGGALSSRTTACSSYADGFALINWSL